MHCHIIPTFSYFQCTTCLSPNIRSPSWRVLHSDFPKKVAVTIDSQNELVMIGNSQLLEISLRAPMNCHYDKRLAILAGPEPHVQEPVIIIQDSLGITNCITMHRKLAWVLHSEIRVCIGLKSVLCQHIDGEVYKELNNIQVFTIFEVKYTSRVINIAILILVELPFDIWTVINMILYMKFLYQWRRSDIELS